MGLGYRFFLCILVFVEVSAASTCGSLLNGSAKPFVPGHQKVVFIGYGGVARATLPLLLGHVQYPLKNITVLDFEDKSKALKEYTKDGLSFQQVQLSPTNFKAILGSLLKPGDLLIDLAWNLDTWELIQWAHENGVLYVNTSVEFWDPYDSDLNAPERTLFSRHQKLWNRIAQWKNKGPSAVLEHGANPGLISHFSKQALVDIAQKYLSDKKGDSAKRARIRLYLKNRSFNYLAFELGVRVIHCSERDTQVTARPRRPMEFYNTWSVEGFFEEAVTAPSEMGWGTHEKWLPPHAFPPTYGDLRSVALKAPGMNTWVRSWVPSGTLELPANTIEGMLVRHGESLSIAKKLTIKDASGNIIYSPTVHYAYRPTEAALASLADVKNSGYQRIHQVRIGADDIVAGEDILGALVMGHDYRSWWTGSILDIAEARRLVPGQNATTIQVAIGVVSAVLWMQQHPQSGVMLPDDLPHEFVLAVAKPFLGKFVSIPVDWDPLETPRTLTADPTNVDRADPWQFKNFYVHPYE